MIHEQQFPKAKPKPSRKSRVWSEPSYKGIVRDTCNALKDAALKRVRDGLTDPEIDAIVTQAIIDAVHERGEATASDFKRLNIPAGEPNPQRFRRCLAKAREMCPSLDARAFSPAA